MDSVVAAYSSTTNIYANPATFDPETKRIWIGWYAFPETCRFSTNLLLYVKQVVQESLVIPITLQSLTIALAGPHPISGPHYGATRSWSACVEAISRSITAYAKTPSGADGSNDQAVLTWIKNSVICYTYDLSLKMEMNNELATKSLCRYIENRALNAAVTNALSKTFVVRDSERTMTMDIIQDLLERLRKDCLAILDDIESFRRTNRKRAIAANP